MQAAPSIIGFETSITDYIYDESRANVALRDAFLHFLKPENPPRKGENILVSIEEMERTLLEFAKIHALTLSGDTAQEQAQSALQQILGTPRTVEAGGSLANSFHLLAKTAIGHHPVCENPQFFTAVGDDEAGQIFAASLEGNIEAAKSTGRTMAAHIIPIDGDRIIIASPSFGNACEKDLPSTLDALRAADFSNAKQVMLGGYLQYTAHYPEALDILLDKVRETSPNPASRPTLVLTAAAHSIAASEELHEALRSAIGQAPLLVFANTGEFRRLMQMDDAWRKPYETRWWRNAKGEKLSEQSDNSLDPNDRQDADRLRAAGWTRLEGNALEEVKTEDPEYLAAKIAANDAAFQAAANALSTHSPGTPVQFVVTNGKYGVRIISNDGISENMKPPKPPHGVMNTVGGGDAFAGGFLLGHYMGLSNEDCTQLGFAAAGEVIGRDEARLPNATNDAGNTGLAAYLNPENPTHQHLLDELRGGQQSIEAEHRFLVRNSDWRNLPSLKTSPIRQDYLPNSADENIQLQLKKDGAHYSIHAVQDGETLVEFPIPAYSLHSFGKTNLMQLADTNGTIIIDRGTEARIRHKDGEYSLGIKRETQDPARRLELEFTINPQAAQVLLPHCKRHVEKTRHVVEATDGAQWEVNVFEGRNKGLTLAEIERETLPEQLPAWLGSNVTNLERYNSRALASAPLNRNDIAR